MLEKTKSHARKAGHQRVRHGMVLLENGNNTSFYFPHCFDFFISNWIASCRLEVKKIPEVKKVHFGGEKTKYVTINNDTLGRIISLHYKIFNETTRYTIMGQILSINSDIPFVEHSMFNTLRRKFHAGYEIKLPINNFYKEEDDEEEEHPKTPTNAVEDEEDDEEEEHPKTPTNAVEEEEKERPRTPSQSRHYTRSETVPTVKVMVRFKKDSSKYHAVQCVGPAKTAGYSLVSNEKGVKWPIINSNIKRVPAEVN